MQTSPEWNGQQADALDRLTRLQALTASLSEAATSEQVAGVILAHAAAVLGTSTGVVARLSDDGGEFICLHAIGYPEEVVRSFRRFPAHARMPLADAVRNGRPVLLASLAERDASYPDLARITGLRAAGALAALPLVVRGKAIGGIGLRFPTERSFSEQDRAFLLTVAGLCAQALERAQFYDRERATRERTEQAEQAWRESEARLRTLSDNLPLGAVYQGVIDKEGRRRCTYISAGIERVLGVTPAEVMADATVLYRLIHEEDRARIASQDETAVRTLTPFDFEFRSWTRSGNLVWLHVRSASRRLANGEIVWEGILLDVTPRKRAEEELAHLTAVSEKRRRLYEAALSNTPDLVYVFDLDHRFTYANEGLLRTWGKTWDEAIGKNCLELGYEPWHAAMHDREIEQVKATRQPIKGEVPFTGTFGRRIYEYILVPVLGENGEVEAVAGTTRDVTERKALEGQLRVQAEQLRDADRRKDEFLATLAHELRNPLAPIRNGLQIMKLAGSNATAIEQARSMMERQMAVMVRLIDDLLDVSRITRGKLDLRKERIDLASVVQSAVEGSRPFIEASGHRLSVILPSEPVLLDADPTRLAQVFANLLTNAAKYTDAGGHIWLAAKRTAGEVAVSIRDTGIGIAPEHLPRLFEMFSQVKAALERSQGGLGIGLSLVKGLVQMHGGTVEARSEGLGRGSEFIVRLPLAADTLERESPNLGSGEQSAGRPGRRVLVADDNRDAAASLALMLRLGGHVVHAVHDGEEAVEAAGWFRPDLALLDIGMPKLNGFEVASHIREQPWGKNVVLVAVTGWGQEEDKRRAVEAGFDLHPTKPVDPTALEQVLAAAARSR